MKPLGLLFLTFHQHQTKLQQSQTALYRQSDVNNALTQQFNLTTTIFRRVTPCSLVVGN